MIKIEIDRNLCIGSGNCCAASPNVFRLDDSEIATVIDATADTVERIVSAARQCPTLAVTVYKDGESLT